MDSANAHNQLGTALVQQGNLSKAEAEFRKALKLDPKHIEAHENLGALEEEDEDEVEDEEEEEEVEDEGRGLGS